MPVSEWQHWHAALAAKAGYFSLRRVMRGKFLRRLGIDVTVFAENSLPNEGLAAIDAGHAVPHAVVSIDQRRYQAIVSWKRVSALHSIFQDADEVSRRTVRIPVFECDRMRYCGAVKL